MPPATRSQLSAVSLRTSFPLEPAVPEQLLWMLRAFACPRTLRIWLFQVATLVTNQFKP